MAHVRGFVGAVVGTRASRQVSVSPGDELTRRWGSGPRFDVDGGESSAGHGPRKAIGRARTPKAGGRVHLAAAAALDEQARSPTAVCRWED